MEYIKVRPYVAKRLGVFAARYRYNDGNVQLWDKDLREVDPGWAFRKAEVVAAIGGLAMDPYRNREEQQKRAEECTPLPLPTDPAWMPMDGEDEITDAPADEIDEGEAGEDLEMTEANGTVNEEAEHEEEGGEG